MMSRRRFITFGRIITTGVVNFGRNVALGIAAMAVMVVTLTIILFSLIANATFANTINQITGKISVTIYLADTVKQDDAAQLMQQIKQLPEVGKVTYTSKEEAIKQYRDQNNSNQDLLSAISESGVILPSSINIYPRDVNNIAAIKSFIDKPDTKKYQDTQYPTSYSGDRKEAVDKIIHATDVLQRVGVFSVAIFAVISVLIIFNTIQMAIFNRRDELTIMRLLGASTGYIRGPFVVESIMYGIISAVVSIALMNLLFVASSSALQASSLGLLDISYASGYFHKHMIELLTLQLGVGILIGAASSTIATRRYLKFKTTK